MSAVFEIPNEEINRLSRNLAANARMVGRELQEEVLQRSLNVAGRAFDAIPPESGNAQGQRTENKQYLDAQVATHIKIAKGGKRKGRFMKRGAHKRQLKRVHLIAQAIMARKGRPGLYGKKMAAYSGKMTGMAQRSVGFLKSVFIPLIVTLNPLCRFKFPFHKTRDISRWPTSAGYGKVKIHKHAAVPFVLLTVGAKARHETGESIEILRKAGAEAVTAEANEVKRHMDARLQRGLDKLNKR